MRRPVHGDRQTNGRVDILEWKTLRGFVGETHALCLLIKRLAARRLYKVDAAEATGILTHYKDHDEDCWIFLKDPQMFTGKHPTLDWLDAWEAVWRR